MTTPLHSYYHRSTRRGVHVRSITTLLRKAAAQYGPEFGISAQDIEARSLRSSGAMALLCARVDTDVIQLIGRWRSDAMFRYLHVQAAPHTAPLAPRMLSSGSFTLTAPLPNPQVA